MQNSSSCGNRRKFRRVNETRPRLVLAWSPCRHYFLKQNQPRRLQQSSKYVIYLRLEITLNKPGTESITAAGVGMLFIVVAIGMLSSSCRREVADAC